MLYFLCCNSEFRARSSSVHQIYTEFLDSRTRYIELLDRYIYFSNFFSRQSFDRSSWNNIGTLIDLDTPNPLQNPGVIKNKKILKMKIRLIMACIVRSLKICWRQRKNKSGECFPFQWVATLDAVLVKEIP